MSLPQTPVALWNCIHEPTSLPTLAEWFRGQFDAELVGDDGKLLFPLCRRLGQRFSRTSVTGISVCKHVGAQFSLYESRELYEAHRHDQSWLEFMAGGWTRECPNEPGMYFARSLEGYQSVRTLVKVMPAGTLHDTSGGFVQTGKVTSWMGDWWSVKVPCLKNAK